MTNLPKTKNLLSVLLSVFLFVALAFPNISLAASAYVSPATGIIAVKNFKVSLYTESTITEPEISASQVKITYPANVSVVSITDGDYDSYTEKNNEAGTRTITINAVNNAGNYKSGKIKLASINFEAQANTGQVQLQIASDSTITGAGGEQLLTEVINGVYTLEIPAATTEATTTTEEATTTTTTTATTEETTTTKGGVPTTGVNDTIPYLVLSVGLIFAGAYSLRKYINKNEQ